MSVIRPIYGRRKQTSQRQWVAPKSSAETAHYEVNEHALRRLRLDPSNTTDLATSASDTDSYLGWFESIAAKWQPAFRLVVSKAKTPLDAAKEIASADAIVKLSMKASSARETRTRVYPLAPISVELESTEAAKRIAREVWRRVMFAPNPSVSTSILGIAAGGSHLFTAIRGHTFEHTIGHASIPWAIQNVSPNTVFVSAPSFNPLATRVHEAAHKRLAELDDDAKAIAAAAVEDAAIFVDALGIVPEPTVFMSDDGLIGINWRDESQGVLIMIAGGREATYSIKKKGGSYSNNMVSFDPTSGIPGELRDAIEQYERTGDAIIYL